MSVHSVPFRCPDCGGALREPQLACADCGQSYVLDEGIPVFVGEVDGVKAEQIRHYDSEVDEEFEITRPHGAVRFYGWILEEKFRRSVTGIEALLEDGTALSVCAGSGLDAEFLARAGASVVAADISLGAARRARERALRYGLPIVSIVADLERLPFDDRSFDVVYVHDGLHHLERPFHGLSEMARVAKHAVSVTEPANAFVTSVAVRVRLAQRFEESGNRVERLSPQLVALQLERDGLETIHIERYGMFYRHEPQWGMRVASSPLIFQLATRSVRGANRVAGALGNKMTVIARRA